jgi:hypothetical protein
MTTRCSGGDLLFARAQAINLLPRARVLGYKVGAVFDFAHGASLANA